MASYQIFSDSCCDLSTIVRKENNISYVHMGIVVDGEETKIYKDNDYKELVSTESNYKVDITNYTGFNKYKYTFTRGNDNMFHFSSIERAE